MLDLNGTSLSFDGNRGLLPNSVSTFDPVIRLDFPTPVSNFGGYWLHATTSDRGGPMDLNFYDATDTVIGTDSFTYNGALGGKRNGLAGTAPSAVEFTGFFAAADGMQIKVSEPNTCLFLRTAPLPTLFRRRNRCEQKSFA